MWLGHILPSELHTPGHGLVPKLLVVRTWCALHVSSRAATKQSTGKISPGCTNSAHERIAGRPQQRMCAVEQRQANKTMAN